MHLWDELDPCAQPSCAECGTALRDAGETHLCAQRQRAVGSEAPGDVDLSRDDAISAGAQPHCPRCATVLRFDRRTGYRCETCQLPVIGV